MKTLPHRIWLLMLGIAVAVAIGAAAFIFSGEPTVPDSVGLPGSKKTGFIINPKTLLKKIAIIQLKP